MSYCTILITQKNQTQKIQREIKRKSGRDLHLGIEIDTKYYSKKDFKNIDLIFSSFDKYDILTMENYSSSFESYTTPADRTKEKNKARIDIFLELAKEYSAAFAYYWQGKDENKLKWQGFRESIVITQPQDKYEENVVYLYGSNVNAV